MSNQLTKRKANGTWAKGYSGNTDGAGGRARRELNADTIREMHRAFREGGRKAIDKVMRTQPAVFLKLLVLLVPREMQIEHKGARGGDCHDPGHAGGPRSGRECPGGRGGCRAGRAAGTPQARAQTR